MNEYQKAIVTVSYKARGITKKSVTKELKLLQELVDRATQMPSAEELKKEISKCSTQSQMIDVLNKFVACYYGETKWSDDE